MNPLSTIAHVLLDGIGPIQTRSANDEPLQEALSAIYRRRATMRPWRVASVDDALAVPSIFSAVTLIASTMGTLSMEAYRNELLMPAVDRPRLIVRPNPNSTPYAFFFLSAFYKATRGERWWWVAKRDADDSAMSLFPVPPWEVRVTANDRNRLRPKIEWGNEEMDPDDMIQDIWFPDPTGLRGEGPLQKAGAAVSVAVEAQEWAANYFGGSIPSIIGTTEQEMTADELAEMDKQWNEKPPNMPRWLTNGLELSASPVNPENAQLTDSRGFQVGEVARMFNMPGPLLEYQMSGSSLTYRNESGIWLDFRQRCIGPIFAEPMEQQMSDLLTRSTTARFNYDQLLRADIKTRYEAYQIGLDAGFLTPEEVRRQEGLNPGAVDFAPVPAALPASIPTRLPVDRPLLAPRSMAVAAEVRCANGHLLAEAATPPYRFTCFRCKDKVAA